MQKYNSLVNPDIIQQVKEFCLPLSPPRLAENSLLLFLLSIPICLFIYLYYQFLFNFYLLLFNPFIQYYQFLFVRLFVVVQSIYLSVVNHQLQSILNLQRLGLDHSCAAGFCGLRNTQIKKYANTQIHKYTNTQIPKGKYNYKNNKREGSLMCSELRQFVGCAIHKLRNTQTHKYTNTQIQKYTKANTNIKR